MGLLLLLIVGSHMAVPLPELAILRAEQPGLLIPGTTQVLLGAEPPGYVVCCAVTRYFEDETLADLNEELSLEARQQFFRFVVASAMKDPEGRGDALTLSGFQRHAVWWEEDALHGLYFVPTHGVEWGENHEQPAEIREPKCLDAPGLLLKGRSLRKDGKFADARRVFEQLRDRFPLSPEARRAMHEIFLSNTAASKVSSE
jgi:hypothetical protein